MSVEGQPVFCLIRKIQCWADLRILTTQKCFSQHIFIWKLNSRFTQYICTTHMYLIKSNTNYKKIWLNFYQQCWWTSWAEVEVKKGDKARDEQRIQFLGSTMSWIGLLGMSLEWSGHDGGSVWTAPANAATSGHRRCNPTKALNCVEQWYMCGRVRKTQRGARSKQGRYVALQKLGVIFAEVNV